MINQHSFIIEGETEEGVRRAEVWAKKHLGVQVKANPDFIVLRYGLLSVVDARRVSELAAQAPFHNEYKVLVISAARMYHEAQNALLKLFEEPPRGTYIFLILPTLGSLLPTLRSRVQVLNSQEGFMEPIVSKVAEEFIKATKEKRSAMIKKLTTGKDEDDRREKRDEVIEVVNGIEAAVYSALKKGAIQDTQTLLSDIATLRNYLYDRSAPVRMILEHLSLVIPKNLL